MARTKAVRYRSCPACGRGNLQAVRPPGATRWYYVKAHKDASGTVVPDMDLPHSCGLPKMTDPHTGLTHVCKMGDCGAKVWKRYRGAYGLEQRDLIPGSDKPGDLHRCGRPPKPAQTDTDAPTFNDLTSGAETPAPVPPFVCATCGARFIGPRELADHHMLQHMPTPHEQEDPDMPEQTPATEPAQAAAPDDAAGRALWHMIQPHARVTVTVDAEQIKDAAQKAVAQAVTDALAPRAVILTVEQPPAAPVAVGLTHRQTPDLIRLISRRGPDGRRQHVQIYGAPGAGKSYAARQAAAAVGLPCYYLSGSVVTPEYRLMGYKDANGTFHGTEWLTAAEAGGVFILDEFDNLSAEALVGCNETLANGWASCANGTFRVSPDFVVIAIGNTLGRGGSRGHETRQTLDLATLDRFNLMLWSYDEALEREILAPVIGPGNAGAVTTWLKTARSRWADIVGPHGEPCPLTPRFGMRLAAALAAGDDWTAAWAVAGAARLGEHAAKIVSDCPPPTITHQPAATPAAE